MNWLPGTAATSHISVFNIIGFIRQCCCHMVCFISIVILTPHCALKRCNMSSHYETPSIQCLKNSRTFITRFTFNEIMMTLPLNLTITEQRISSYSSSDWMSSTASCDQTINSSDTWSGWRYLQPIRLTHYPVGTLFLSMLYSKLFFNRLHLTADHKTCFILKLQGCVENDSRFLMIT